MDLDDLRRRWQQQPSGPETPSETTEQSLNTMLAQRTTGPIAQLRHNVQRDARLIIPIVLLNFLNFLNITWRTSLEIGTRYIMLGLIASLLVLLTASIFRRLQLVRQMENSGADLYSQLKTTSRKLRQLLQTTRLMAIVMLLVVCGLFLFKMHTPLLEYLNPEGEQWGMHMAVFAVGIVGFALMVIALYVLGKVKQQRRYGQYLDQLEATLRELEE